MKIIVIIGLPGSGKSAACNFLSRKGINVYKSGSVIKDEVIKRGLKLTVESEEHISRELRKEHGMDAPIRLLGSMIERDKSEIICIDGLRNVEEVRYAERFGDVFLVETRSPKSVRHERIILRADPRDPKTRNEAEWRDRMEIGRGLGKLLEMEKYTKFVINNNGSLRNLENRLDEVLKKIKKRA